MKIINITSAAIMFVICVLALAVGISSLHQESSTTTLVLLVAFIVYVLTFREV